MTLAAPIVQGFFTQRLAQQRVSANTVIAYRDCLRLLLRFAQDRTTKQPSMLDMADLDAELVGAFLDHLETDRHNGIETRNLRLAAIHSLFRYAQLRCPEHAEVIARVLAIPAKRPDSTIVSYLTPTETVALLAAPDRSVPLGRRDHLLILVAVQTGLRVSELTGLNCGDITYGTGAHVYTEGKGRRQRRTPLTPPTAKLLRDWIEPPRRQPGRTRLHHQNRRAAEHRRCGGPHRQTRHRRSPHMRDTAAQTCNPAHPSALLRHEPPG